MVNEFQQYVSFLIYIAAFIIIYSYALIIFCGISIHRAIRKEAVKYSIKKMRYQTQVSIILLIDAIIPVITVVTPTCIDWVASYFKFSTPWLGPVRKTITCLAPLLNPIIKISVVSCYRAAVFRFVWKTVEDSTNIKIFSAITRRTVY